MDAEIIPDMATCIAQNLSWVNNVATFDHVGQAYLSLLEVAIFKGWAPILYSAADSRDVSLKKYSILIDYRSV